MDGPVRTGVADIELTRRALQLVLGKTTEMADDVLRVPLHYYRDPKITEIEEQQILRRTPLAIVSSAQVASAGDYVVRTVLGDSLLVTRDKDGRSHVFLNYCRHRGAMPACGSGNSTRFTCPYHAWTYRNDGTLFTVPGATGFAGVDKADYGLVELPNQERHGFIWAVLTADADIDVDEHLGPLGPDLAALDYASFGYHDVREFESEVSWKGALEAFAESYHFPFVHGESLIGQNALANTSIHDGYGKHHRMGFPFNWIANLQSDESASWDVRDNMGVIYWIYPNLVLANSNVGVEVIDILPAGSPTRCTVRHSWLARVPAPDDATRAGYDMIFNAVHAAVRDEDFVMLPQCGEGVRRGQHDHMIIGRNEIGVQHMIRVFAQELGVALS
ncbi:aromatic ring-hydroxylating dioxygenase subunit alpha [Mycolicibacterium sp. CAU 1645]|uniref:Aromatic ring-hydroxylating dioxygenase subunit alpha n=1 Tax=Mycolicibacterium arenosum TaxID=2952157 RepID=A0ABT1M3D1_9MYCO|nr:aromatic ring-hydroxylating dioxygenase subunit alpha [Mycolicibacterium sp. CAU 1645]MCP9273671.1 aromatic ring-hydroxylating dioxygenase subunit alpha [Mycolicibacterium sp. CAU 1645]